MSNDPIVTMSRNDGLEWASKWIENASSGATDQRLIEFARNMAMSIRAAKEEVCTQSFEEAIINDPYMKPEQKAAWLGLATGGKAKILFLRAATLEHEGRNISICAERIDDIRAVWDTLVTDPPLDEDRLERIIVMPDSRYPVCTKEAK